jgi:RNA polymerase sigma factor (sigma-70 family)
VITAQEENTLIDRILAGERQLYAQLVDKYKSYAVTIAFKIVENKPEAEEAAQDAFIKAFQYLKGFNRQAKFSTWLYRIVFNTAVSYRRKNRHQFQDIANTHLEYHERSDGHIEREDQTKFLAQAMTKLNDADQLAIRLYYMKELSLEEVAETMGQNLNTVKVRVHRARQRLADELRRILNREALTL